MNILITASKNEPNNAAPKPSTLNPGTSFATSKNIKALMTKVNKPKVRMLIGRVKSNNKGLMNMLTNPITNAAQKAGITPARLIPGTTQATNNKAKE